MKTIILLIASNIFMTFAWYFYLKQEGWPLWNAIAISWLIALFEYMLMVPANRNGYVKGLSGFQLKMIQEVITLIVFGVFAVLYLKEPFHRKYFVSFAFLPEQFILYSAKNLVNRQGIFSDVPPLIFAF